MVSPTSFDPDQIEGLATVSPRAARDAYIAFQNMTPDGFMMFDTIRGPSGRIVDFEWVFVNTAAGAISGRRPEDLVGRRFLQEMPGVVEDGLFDRYVEVVETGSTWQDELSYDHDGITGWFRVTAARTEQGFALSFADITEVRERDKRLRNLIDSVIAFVGVLGLDGTLLEANEPAVAASGLSREELVGRPFWDCFWWNFDARVQARLKAAIAQAAQGERVRYDEEIRVVGDQKLWIDFQIVPVLDADGNVVELIPSGVDITERKQSEAHRELLITELSHRVKNTLATIQSMAGQTLRTAQSMDGFRDAFNARLRSISASHDLLVASEHQTASLSALIRSQVLPYVADSGRLSLGGTDILLPGDVAHALGLILHELAANAAKYGALSTDSGRVAVTWDVDTADRKSLLLTWAESGGPPVEKPTRRGFGTRLIQRSLGQDTDGAVLEYLPTGVSCKLTVALK